MMRHVVTPCDRVPHALLFAGLLLCGASSHAAESPSLPLDRLEEQAFQEAAALPNPSIVRIQTIGGVDRVGRLLTGTSPTTGVIVSADGYLISSVFNFISKPNSIIVTLSDGRRFPANVVASDFVRMLTLLRIDAKDLPVPAFAKKTSFRTGQWAIALGRTYDINFPNISVGIVSALDRVWGKAIQTDAKVSPANYGGPLVDIDGKVMGILVPLSPNDDSETAGFEWYDSGIGFAIPFEDVLAILPRLSEGNDLKRGLLGVTLSGMDLFAPDPTIATVQPNSPAQEAGLLPNDQIVAIAGQPVERLAHVRHILGTQYAGDTIKITVKRQDQTIDRSITLVDHLEPYEAPFLGILPARETIQKKLAGIGLRFVYPDSPAAKAGLTVKDRVIRFGGHDVNSVPDVLAAEADCAPGDSVDVTLLRGTQTVAATVTLSSIPEDVLTEIAPVAFPTPTPDAEGAKTTSGRMTVEATGEDLAYWAYVPADYNPNYQYTLLIWIHPVNDTMEADMMRLWKPICDRRGIILLAPSCGMQELWEASHFVQVKRLVETFQSNYSIAPDRVCMHGFSTGGVFAFYLAFELRDIVRGAAIVSSAFLAPIPDNQPGRRLQLYLASHPDEKTHTAVQSLAKRLRQAKFPTTLANTGKSDTEYLAADAINQLARWIDSLDRL